MIHWSQDKKSYMKDNIHREPSNLGTPMVFHKTGPLKETNSGQRATIAKICEEGKMIVNRLEFWSNENYYGLVQNSKTFFF